MPEPSHKPTIKTGKDSPGCPYPGLRSYFTDETDWYFGRESHTHDALTRIEKHRFLAIVGASGAGKSSLVFAGIIPALKAGDFAGALRSPDGSPAPWSILHFRPGGSPLKALTEALVKHSVSKDDPLLTGFVQSALHSGDMGLIEALKTAGHLKAKCETLVYIDQLEELFHYGNPECLKYCEDAQRFARLLVTAATQSEVRLHLLLSMRSDFIGDCDRFPGLPELICGSQFLTPRLTRKQMERSFGLPAEVQGWSVEPEALNTLLNDCGNSPDQLPLAQHVIRRMWRKAEADCRSTLTLSDYHDVGGFKSSLSEHGREILGKLRKETGPGAEDIARRLFMSLCDQSEDGPLVRRASDRDELSAIIGCSNEDLEPIMRAFGGDDPGFIREDETGLVDVRHESVLRQWHQIGEWRRQETESEDWLHQLSKAAREMESTEFDQSTLWRGNKLRRVLDWKRNTLPNPAWAARHGVANWSQCEDFLIKSVKAEGDAIGKVRIKRIAIGFVVSVLLVAAFAFWRKADIEKARREATAKHSEELKEANRIARDQTKLAEFEAANAKQQTENLKTETVRQITQLSELNAKVNNERKEMEETLEKVNKQIDSFLTDFPDYGTRLRPATAQITKVVDQLQDPLVATLKREGPIQAAQYSSDGRYIALGSEDKTLSLWSRAGGEKIAETRASSSVGGVLSLAFSPNQGFLLTGSAGSSIRLFDPQRKELGNGINVDEQNSVYLIRFSKNGDYSVAFDYDRLAQLRDWRAYPKVLPTSPSAVWSHPGPITYADFSHDGTRLVTSCDDGSVRVFEASGEFNLLDVTINGKKRNPLPLGAPTRKFVFSPTDQDLVVGGVGKSSIVWFYLTGNREPIIRGGKPSDGVDEGVGGHDKDGSVWDIAFRRSGTHFASVASDGLCLVWDVETATSIARLDTKIEGRLFDVAWSESDLIALGGEDGWIELWDLKVPSEPERIFSTQAHQASVWSIQFDPRSEQLLTFARDIRELDSVGAIASRSGRAKDWIVPPSFPAVDNEAKIWDIDAARRKGSNLPTAGPSQ